LRVPANLGWWRGVNGGAEWLDSLTAIVASCADQWSLRVGEPFEDGNVSLTLPAERESGQPAVLEVNFPEPESEHEANALAFWDGHGAARLIESDPLRRALLVERCEPGDQLWSVTDDEEATRTAAAVLSRLGRGIVDEVLFRTLAGEAEREPWLAIDPRPLVGEREFDAASLLRDRRWLLREPGMKTVMRRRLDLISAELELDRERMRRWGIAHALAWGVSGHGIEHDMVECARILVELET
jgi:streptomycin 6-kinase